MAARDLARFKDVPKHLLRPVPAWVYTPFLQRAAGHIARKHPRLFRRLGPHSHKNFLIQFTNLPFVLLLQPHPGHVRIEVFRDARHVEYDAKISGSFLDMLRLLDGRMDGDAIFFSRALRVEGDTEAVVSLRNALDDVEGSIAGDVADLFGAPGRAGLSFLRRIEA
ncbi:MAG: SCP2 sterol-binding domain-containing protein [Alphaproteobacteria bacterium]|nr:SCP2 sterol-binding domain-containing protein [Alphaproteobacteria bacterium]